MEKITAEKSELIDILENQIKNMKVTILELNKFARDHHDKDINTMELNFSFKELVPEEIPFHVDSFLKDYLGKGSVESFTERNFGFGMYLPILMILKIIKMIDRELKEDLIEMEKKILDLKIEMSHENNPQDA